jgi:hypothetical protein
MPYVYGKIKVHKLKVGKVLPTRNKNATIS